MDMLGDDLLEGAKGVEEHSKGKIRQRQVYRMVAAPAPDIQAVRQKLNHLLEFGMVEQSELRAIAADVERLYVDVQTLEYATKSAKATQLGTALDHGLNGLAAGRLIPRNYLIAAPELVAILEKNIPALKIAGTAIHARHRSSMM
ncbi:hypothetical protein CAF53_11750 [Sphingobium sp. LB126]|uniref:hypothetical protein n=1 Tax=Sphingobium sp. LB126 TaxID=1983755 RepID=UPI000C2001EB|nr:hypothetical protein [Sphingobium sp. LB126]PJG48839.1 hypothetical protein CAF53_11750 [Sphingobium sp. LB126]